MLAEAGAPADTCCVCLEELGGGRSQITLPCKHTFHSACIRKWLHDSRTGPICKADAAGADAAEKE